MITVLVTLAGAYLVARAVRAFRTARAVLEDLLAEIANAPAAPVSERRWSA